MRVTEIAFIASLVSFTPIFAQDCEPAEIAKLVASDGSEDDWFGDSVSISDDFAVIGVQEDNGNGSAYIFRRNEDDWIEEAELVASDGAANDRFGDSVSISGQVVVVGAFGDDDHGSSSGSAYIFRYDGADLDEETKLVASDASATDQFGSSVSVAGDVVAIGALGDDDLGTDSGSAYIFRFNGSEWIQEQKLLASDGNSAGVFGTTIVTGGNVALIGAPGDKGGIGSVYVFRFDGTSWLEEAKLVPSTGVTGDLFGWQLAISPTNDLCAIGSQDDDNGTSSGSVYVFRYDGTTWLEEAQLFSSDSQKMDFFGRCVAISRETLLVGATGDDDTADRAGAMYLFRHDGADWLEENKLLASDGNTHDWFGTSVAMSAGTAVIGAVGDDDNGRESGSTYVFDVGCASCLDLTVDNLIAGKRATFVVSGGEPFAKAVTVFGTQPGIVSVVNYGGYCATFRIKDVKQNKVIGGFNRRFDANGELTFKVSIPVGLSGQRILFQSAEHDTCPDECTSNLIDMVIG